MKKRLTLYLIREKQETQLIPLKGRVIAVANHKQNYKT